MKKYPYILILALALLSGGISGCYEDNSALAQRDIPNVYIDIDRSISNPTWLAYVGEELVLDIPIIWNGEKPEAFDFKWTLNNEVISTEQVLKYTFTLTGSYNVAFQIIERATGLAVGESLGITVSSKFLLGWLILSDKGGRSALDFIHIDSHELYPDIHNTLYPNDPLGSEPHRLAEHFTAAYDQITVIQHGGQGLVELDGRSFEKVITTKEEFIGEEYPYAGFKPVDVYYTNINSYAEILLTDRGEAYARQNRSSSGIGAFQTAQYPSTPLEHPDGTIMNITYYTFPKLSSYYTLFDGTQNRWLAFIKQTDVLLPPLEKLFDPTEPDPNVIGPEFFDFCDGMDPKIKLVYAQTCDEWSNGAYLVNILKDTETGKYYYQKTTLVYETSPRNRVTVKFPYQYEFASGYGINDESVFWMLRGQNSRYQDSPHVFFTVGNKLYVYREQNDKVYLFKDFGMVNNPPSGKVVAIMHNTAPPTSERLQDIAVAFSDGHFFIMHCTTVMDAIARGDLDPSKPADAAQIEIAHFSGLGNIKHAIFKYGRFANWSSEEERLR